MLLQSPVPCSTVQHYKKSPSKFFLIVNGTVIPVKTPQYNASQHALSFSCWLFTASSLLTVSKAVKAIQMSTFTYCFLPHS